ncbi:DUF2125 domain-containing protein [Roseovarius sp. 2305UL8-3]|uniref:DUF2125 domain-containing protein n=1 Tax=Roseovarius conchicola TaxID=3121636 RepID=UPI003528D2FC
MTKLKAPVTSVLALGLGLSGTAAFADLTAQDVWADWKDYMSGFGYEITGEESTSGDTLTIKDLAMAMDMPEGAGSFSMSISEFSFTDNGDGTVNMTIPAVMPITVSVDTPDAEDVDMKVDYVTDSFEMVASGDPDNLTYAYTADELSMILKELVVEGEPVDIGTANVTLAALSGQSNIRNGNIRMIDQTIAAGPVTYAMDFVDPEGEGRMVLNGKFDTMNFSGGGSFPDGMDPNNMASMLKAGFGFAGGFDHTGGSFNMNFQEDGETVQVNTNSEDGKARVAMDEGQLLYDVSANNTNIQMAGAEIPFPIELAMAQSGFKLMMPISKAEGEQDFALGITLGDFTMSDLLWGLFDPAAQLPRDPATIAMDVSGKAKLFFDVMDPEQMAAVETGDEMPGELNALTLNSLTVSAAGAELTGNGDFTFDNSDLTTFDGMPAPEGAVDLSLSGGNGLLDKLVAMGLLPEEQAMGARMMMGLFAIPGEGDDMLTSKIEVKSDGQVLANGQRLR